MDREKVTVAEAAERLGISTIRVYQLINDGSLEADKSQKPYMVYVDSLAPYRRKADAWLTAHGRPVPATA